MDTYQFELRLIVDVEAPSRSDAESALEDQFGTGPDGCANVRYYDVKKVKQLTNA